MAKKVLLDFNNDYSTVGACTDAYETENGVDSDRMRSMIMRRTIQEKLTDKQRECITLYFGRRMSMTEIAEAMGVGKSTVSRHIKVGKSKIKEMLIISGAKGSLHFFN